MKYILRKRRQTQTVSVLETLNDKGVWEKDPASPMLFFNPRKASVWAINNLDDLDASVFVEGPNGGQYRIMNGRIKLTGIRKGWGSL